MQQIEPRQISQGPDQSIGRWLTKQSSAQTAHTTKTNTNASQTGSEYPMASWAARDAIARVTIASANKKLSFPLR